MKMGGIGDKIMVGALTGMMGPVLYKLTNLIEQKFTDLKNVRKKMELLRKELIAINLTLEKHATKAWAADMHEVAYDIEDNIDLFTLHVDHEPPDTTTRVKRFFLKLIRKVKKLKYHHKFAKDIQELHDLVNDRYRHRKRYKIDEGSSSISHTEVDPRLQALYVEVEKLIGIEGPSQEIFGLLAHENPSEQQRVVSIVGFGGSGKTMLAKQVYEKIKGQFSCVAFVYVSQNPDMNNLL
jgi:hypothetical protein